MGVQRDDKWQQEEPSYWHNILSQYYFLSSYINDLPDKVLSQLAMYADDSTLYCVSPNSSNTSRCEVVGVSLNNDLESVLKWGNDWLVTFNARKTKLLSLSRSRDDTFPSIHMGPSTLPEVSDFRLLGLDISKMSVGRGISQALQRVLPCELVVFIELGSSYLLMLFSTCIKLP